MTECLFHGGGVMGPLGFELYRVTKPPAPFIINFKWKNTN